jgi:hypothetical protein
MISFVFIVSVLSCLSLLRFIQISFFVVLPSFLDKMSSNRSDLATDLILTGCICSWFRGSTI